jgi:hypothetical protein
MRRLLVRMAGIASLVASAACAEEVTKDCGGIGYFAAYFVVTDSITGELLPNARGAAGTPGDPTAPELFASPSGRGTYVFTSYPGRYRIWIESPGYAQWQRTIDVASEGGPCGKPIPTTFQARLQRPR